jgi:hypothetical protein
MRDRNDIAVLQQDDKLRPLAQRATRLGDTAALRTPEQVRDVGLPRGRLGRRKQGTQGTVPSVSTDLAESTVGLHSSCLGQID